MGLNNRCLSMKDRNNIMKWNDRQIVFEQPEIIFYVYVIYDFSTNNWRVTSREKMDEESLYDWKYSGGKKQMKMYKNISFLKKPNPDVNNYYDSKFIFWFPNGGMSFTEKTIYSFMFNTKQKSDDCIWYMNRLIKKYKLKNNIL